MASPRATRDRILDAASDIVINDGIDAATPGTIAHLAGVDGVELDEAFESHEHLLMALLDREHHGIRNSIADDVERDPRGGLLSRIFGYSLPAVHERPLTRALYLQDPQSLQRIVRTTQATGFYPRFVVDHPFLVDMQRRGMIRADVDAHGLAAFLAAYTAGTALTAPESDIDATTTALVTLLERGVDADVTDTEPGKRALFELLGRTERC